MEILEEYVDEESLFTERNNSKREPIQEEITNNSFELLQTVKELRTEMETVKKENERILRPQEELIQILMERFHNEKKDKRIESEDMPYQHKDKKTNNLESKVAHLLRLMAIHIKRIINILVIVANIIIIPERESLNLMKKSLENSRKSSHQPLMVKLRREKR